MLPNANDQPTATAETPIVDPVTHSVASNFLPPVWRKLPPPSGEPPPVPEVSVDEHDGSCLRKHEVWSSGEGSNVAAKAQAMRAKKLPKRDFGTCVLAANV